MFNRFSFVGDTVRLLCSIHCLLMVVVMLFLSPVLPGKSCSDDKVFTRPSIRMFALFPRVIKDDSQLIPTIDLVWLLIFSPIFLLISKSTSSVEMW